jgi:hypothetical protein
MSEKRNADDRAYVPEAGTRVRVVEVHPGDNDPEHAVGDEVTADDCTEEAGCLEPGWCYLSSADRTSGTWCRVEPVCVGLPEPAATALPLWMRNDSASRKGMPVALGALAYAPDAFRAMSAVSLIGNAKHCPGKPLRWDPTKSTDEADALVRHLLDHLTGAPVDAEFADFGELAHLAQMVWRANMLFQREANAVRARHAK